MTKRIGWNRPGENDCGIKAAGINAAQRIAADVRVRVDAAIQSDGVAFDVSARVGIVIAVPICIKIGFCVVVLSRKEDVQPANGPPASQ